MAEHPDWIPWHRRGTLPETPGIYIIAKGNPANVIYIGRTWNRGGLRRRIRAFHRSATTGRKGHSGGRTCYRLLGPEIGDFLVCIDVPEDIDPDPRILRPWIEYAERRRIWEHVEQHGELPVCNSA